MSTDINRMLSDWQARSIGMVEAVAVNPNRIQPSRHAERMSFLGAHCTYVEFTAPDGRHGYISWEDKAYEITIAPRGSPAGSTSRVALGGEYCTLADAIDAVMEEIGLR